MQIVWKSDTDGGKKTFSEIHTMDLGMARAENVIGGGGLIPSVVDAKTPKEELIYLLKLASEIEQTLLIQYMYTAYSISDDTSASKHGLIKVSIQEMGHLLAVQNLLLSVGGIEELHLHKSEIRTETKFTLLPYTLEPLSKALIAKYVAVEAPSEIPDDIKNEMQEIRELAFKSAGVTFNPVGGLYEKIFWILQGDDKPVPNMMQLKPGENFKTGWHIKDEDFIPQAELLKFESDLQHWKLGRRVGENIGYGTNDVIFSQIHKRLEALQLVNDIAVQGERSDSSNGIDSHFEIFLEIFRNFKQTPPPVIKVPSNPITRANSEFKNPIEIKNIYTLLWCELFNKLYTSLLMDIYSSMFYKQFDISNQVKFVRLIRLSMTNYINLLTTNVLFKLPLLNNGFTFEVEPLAAPTFEIDSSFSLSTKKDEVDQANSDLISDIRDLIIKIKAHSDFEKHNQHKLIENITVEQFLADIEASYCSIKSQLITTLIP